MEYWTINPVMFQIGPVTARWYGFMYSLTFLVCYLYIQYSKHGKTLKLTPKEKDAMTIFGILGIILGARIGYILFYNFTNYLENPIKIFSVWEGGMASHGAVIGLALSILLFSILQKKDFLKLTDVITAIAPAGIILVRIGNFINGELYGKIAENFCIHFPADPGNCRYPSQLFQDSCF
jgi:phosphatidylglycerol:prolipoprotein diacylglycerol transferase